MAPLDLIVSCTEPVPQPDHLTGWAIRTAGGSLIAEGQLISVQSEDDAGLWIALQGACDWLRAFRLPVGRLTIEHFSSAARETLAWGKTAPATTHRGFAGPLIEFFNSRPYPWDVAQPGAALEDGAHRPVTGEGLPTPLQSGDELVGIDRAGRATAAELTRASGAVRDLYDRAPCGYHSIDPDGTIVAMNHTEAEWLGYRVAEIVGRVRFVDLVSPRVGRRTGRRSPGSRSTGPPPMWNSNWFARTGPCSPSSSIRPRSGTRRAGTCGAAPR